MEWISVKDKLPEQMLENANKKAIKVLVTIKNENGLCVRSQTRMRFYDYTKSEYHWNWKFSPGDVTHWMPLPGPPAQ